MTTTILVDGVELHVERHPFRRAWDAWYNDNPGVTYEADTKREGIADALSDREYKSARYV